ncbi:MAG: tyrosine-type recombinase/integrase [Desulfovibrio sp.]|jgi:site-specific recombinase XerD
MAVCKRKDGRWQVTYRDGEHVRSKAFPPGREGKRQAKAFAGEITTRKARREELVDAQPQVVYLQDLVQSWVIAKKANGLKQWVRDWVSVFNSVFLPALGRTPVHMLTQDAILDVINEHYALKAQATRKRYLGYLKTALNIAVERNIIAVNPLAKFKMKKEERRKSPLTLESLELIIGKARKHLAWAIQVAWNIPCRPGQDLYSLTFSQNVKWRRGGVEVFHRKVGKWVFVRCSDEFMQALMERRRQHKSDYLIEYKGRSVADIGTALSNAAKRAGLKFAVCPYDIRHLWITTMLDKQVEISAIAHLAGTSVRMIIKNYYEPHSSETEKAAALLPKLGTAQEAPLRLVKQVQVA